MWQSFVCAMVAAVTLQIMNPFRTDQLVLYQVSYTSGYHGFELIPFIFLGIMGGIYGGLFIKLNMKIAKWRRNLRLSKYPVMEVCLVALLTALVNYPNKFMKARPSKLVHVLFAECGTFDDYGICQTDAPYTGTVIQLLLAAALGFLFSTVTFGLRIPAGIILPSMAIGALYGRVVGVLMQFLQQAHPNWLFFLNCEPDRECVTPGTYAIVGAASALGGVTRMTVSIVVIMFELTGALTYVLPIMIAVMMSKWIGDAFGKRGIYESWIRFNEYPFLDNRDDRQPPDIPAAQVMTKIDELATISAVGHTLQSLQEFLDQNQFRGFPIVANQTKNIFLGYISRTELTYAIRASISEPRKMPLDTVVFFSHQPHADPLTTVDFRPWMDQTPITLNSQSTFQLTVDLFQKLGLKYVLFLDKGALQGLLTKKDIWYILNSAEDDGVGIGEDPVTPRIGRASEERGLLSARTPSFTVDSPFFQDR
jgi:chloride channel 3/4/5